MPIIKVLARKSEAPAILARAKLLEAYDAFLLVEASQATARALSRKYPVEDVTNQYQIPLGETAIDTSKPRVTRTGAVRAHPAYRGADKLKPGPHHYLVQFTGPAKPSWLTRLRGTGVKLRRPQGGFSFVVRAKEADLPKIA